MNTTELWQVKNFGSENFTNIKAELNILTADVVGLIHLELNQSRTPDQHHGAGRSNNTCLISEYKRVIRSDKRL